MWIFIAASTTAPVMSSSSFIPNSSAISAPPRGRNPTNSYAETRRSRRLNVHELLSASSAVKALGFLRFSGFHSQPRGHGGGAGFVAVEGGGDLGAEQEDGAAVVEEGEASDDAQQAAGP